MVTQCVNFCVDELLWMLTWGWYQLAFGVFFIWLIFMFIGRLKMIPALALALGSYAFSIVVYFSCVGGLFVHYFQLQFVPGEIPQVYGALHASLLLGLIYSFLQFFFYCIIRYWHRLPVISFFIASLIGNTFAALLASLFIKITF